MELHTTRQGQTTTQMTASRLDNGPSMGSIARGSKIEGLVSLRSNNDTPSTGHGTTHEPLIMGRRWCCELLASFLLRVAVLGKLTPCLIK